MIISEKLEEYEFPSKNCFIQTLLEGREGSSSIRFPKPPKFKCLPTTRCIHDSECLTSCNQKNKPRGSRKGLRVTNRTWSELWLS